MRYFIELQYRGTHYHGWQIQPNAITVQEVLNQTLSTLLKEEINVVGAGRTDTGVHASYYVAHFDTEKTIDTENFVYKWNRFLPNDIYIFGLQQVAGDAHARFSAIAREYKYYVSTRKNPFRQDFSYRHTCKPAIDLMNEAAGILLSVEDFTSFSKLHTQVENNLCDVQFAQWEQKADEQVFTIRANRFLRNMVRAIVGTLLDVGCQKISPEEFRRIIDYKNRSKAGFSVPAHALFLTDIIYPEEIFTPIKNNYR